MKLIKTLLCDFLMITIAPEVMLKFHKNKLNKEDGNNLSKYATWVITLVDKIGG